MTFGLLQHIGGFLKHFSPIYTHKNTSSKNDSLEVKFLEFFKEKKLQENTVDPDLELKKELLLWIQKEK